MLRRTALRHSHSLTAGKRTPPSRAAGRDVLRAPSWAHGRGTIEGMTKTYNRFHDPYEDDPEIAALRELHAAMDRAVLDAYGWTDIPTDCEFLLDYEIDEATWGRKKKPYRYRWPDPVRDEVLARLLALNAERAAEEARSGGAASGANGRKRTMRSCRPVGCLLLVEWMTPGDDDGRRAPRLTSICDGRVVVLRADVAAPVFPVGLDDSRRRAAPATVVATPMSVQSLEIVRLERVGVRFGHTV